MQSARERLRKWFDSKGWSLREAARQLECDNSYPGKLLSGERQPGLDLAFRIETLSADWSDGGPILAREWTSSAEPAAPTADEAA